MRLNLSDPYFISCSGASTRGGVITGSSASCIFDPQSLPWSGEIFSIFRGHPDERFPSNVCCLGSVCLTEATECCSENLPWHSDLMTTDCCHFLNDLGKVIMGTKQFQIYLELATSSVVSCLEKNPTKCPSLEEPMDITDEEKETQRRSGVPSFIHSHTLPSTARRALGLCLMD